MSVNVEVNIKPVTILNARGLGGDKGIQKFLASEVVRFCDPYVPMSSGAGAHMKGQTEIASDGSYIIYGGGAYPYAHYQYYGKVMVGQAPKKYTGADLDYHGAPMRGAHWDKRMMADKSKDLEKSVAEEIKKEADYDSNRNIAKMV